MKSRLYVAFFCGAFYSKKVNKKWKRITENILEFTFTPTFAHTLAVTNEQFLDKYAAKQSKARMGIARFNAIDRGMDI